MRHTFIPDSEQNALKRSYRVNIAIVTLFLVSLAGLISLGALFPAFISAYTEERAQINAAALLRKDKDSDETARIQNELQADSAKLSILSQSSSPVRPSVIVERLISARGSVRISSITLNDISTSTASVVIQGVAPTREALVALKTRLESLSPGNKADLPISGLAQSRNITFSMKVTHILP